MCCIPSTGLLYFAGHGYENYGNSFMVPTDAPASYTSEHCLCVQNILTRMQEKETGLNVLLLDMCRKRYDFFSIIIFELMYQLFKIMLAANILMPFIFLETSMMMSLFNQDCSR